MKIAFIGGGNMAAALIGGVLTAGRPAADIAVLEIDTERAREVERRHGVEVHAVAGPWLSAADVVVLAVKPQQMRAAADAIRPHLGRPLVLSIAAGVRAGTLVRWLDTELIVRTMPNTPALIGAGITAAVALPAVNSAQREQAEAILSAVGPVVWLEDERLLDPVTAISGSGPAYVFYLLEAMQQAAHEMGLADDAASALALQTVLGAARLAVDSGESPARLRERVTSRGGTTAAALATFDASGVAQALVRGMHAANTRAHELGDEFDR
jgi:pyrroline-5-carboxylate reductase